MSRKPFCHLLYRPRPEPRTGIPLGARSVGHYLVPADFSEEPRVKHFTQVFWGIKGTGVLVLDGVERRLGPQQLAVYLPGMEHRIHSQGEEWEYRWWTLDGPFAATLTAAFGLGSDVYQVGPAPVKVFEKLARAIRDISPEGELRASASAYELLSRTAAGREGGRSGGKVEQALELIHREWHNPGFGVERLASRVGLHRSSLSRRFSAQVGISPVAYITNLRIQNALSLLKESDKPVGQIARLCGYRDPNYFSRLMRRVFGQSPREFRKAP